MRLIVYIGFIFGSDMFQIVTDLYGKLIRNVYTICHIDELNTYVINRGHIMFARYYNKNVDVMIRLTDMGNKIFVIASVTVNEKECNIDMLDRLLQCIGLKKLYESDVEEEM